MNTHISHQDSIPAQLGLFLSLDSRSASKARKSLPARPKSCSNCGQPLAKKRGYQLNVTGRVCKDCCISICECGKQKQMVRRLGGRKYLYTPACLKCMDMDGLHHGTRVSRPAEGKQDIIGTLRVSGRSNWDAIRLSIPYLSERTLYRCMDELIAAGRVKRHEVDDTDRMSAGGTHYAVSVAEFDLIGRQVLHTGFRN